MAAKQLPGRYAPDGSKYGTLTNGAGSLGVLLPGTVAGSAKIYPGSQAPDGSIYFTLTDGTGTLV